MSRRNRDSRPLTIVAVALLGVVLVAARVFHAGCAGPSGPASDAANFPAYTPIDIDRAALDVLDGDTVRYRGRDIRFIGCDTPEKASPFFVGDQEPHASRATAFTKEKIAGARRVTMQVIAEPDRYGRLLGVIFVDGVPLSLLLVQAGHAVETISTYGDNGFPEIAAEIEAAAKDAKVEFQNPADWRRNHRRQGQ